MSLCQSPARTKREQLPLINESNPTSKLHSKYAISAVPLVVYNGKLLHFQAQQRSAAGPGPFYCLEVPRSQAHVGPGSLLQEPDPLLLLWKVAEPAEFAAGAVGMLLTG